MSNEHISAAGTRSEAAILFLQEMLVDIFGIIIPGFCCILLIVTALAFPLVDLAQEMRPLEHIGYLAAFISQNATTAFFTVLLFSFVVGHLLYRQDPKEPDLRSINRCWRDISKSGCVRALSDECNRCSYLGLKTYLARNGPRELAELVSSSGEYPYSHLKNYLGERGFDHLATLIEWNGEDFEERSAGMSEARERRRKRSKHFINTLKLTVKQANSRLYFDILRNEAHIRLMSSVWFGSRMLIIASLLGLVIGAAANLLPAWEHKAWRWYHFEAILFPFLVFVLAAAAIYGIERFFHYQRVREIVFVLQAFHLTQTPKDAQKASAKSDAL
jgi:hypothetical protein